MTAETDASLPVLDLRDLAHPESAAAFERKLRDVTRNIGFFYLVGVPLGDLGERILKAAREFFALPVEEKRKIDMVNSPRFSGYTRPFGEKTQGEANTREMLDIWPEVPALSPEELEGKPAYYRLPGPNQWPERVPALKGIVEEWQRVVGDAAHLLLRAWARSLGQEDDYFDRHFENPTTRMKIVRYPPSEVKAGEDGPLGVGAHKDGGCVTLLWVQPGVGGLQVWRDGAWADVAPAPEDGFVCNIGEMVELATDGYLKATVHRVAPGEERISVPMFFNPSLDARLPKITLPEKFRKEIEREEGERKVDTTHDDQIFETYGDNLLKSRLRSHTDVAERWYADLLAARQVSA